MGYGKRYATHLHMEPELHSFSPVTEHSNYLTRYETDPYPIKLHIDYKILIFHKHIWSMIQYSVVYQVLLMDKNLHRSHASHIVTFTSYIENLNLMDLRHVKKNNCNLENSNKKQIKSILFEY